MNCPKHNLEMIGKATRYGMRYACPADGCTVVGWDGDTSTPADAETREARRQSHYAFDALWRHKIAFRCRGQAYAWLKELFGIPQTEAHIGKFDLAQCKKLIAACDELAAGQ